LAWVGEAAEVTDLGGKGDRGHERHAAHGLQCRDHGRQRPPRQQSLDLGGQPVPALLGVGDGVTDSCKMIWCAAWSNRTMASQRRCAAVQVPRPE